MKHDINILPILTKVEDREDITINRSNEYKIIKEENGERSFKFSFALCMNGIPLRNYNVYAFLVSIVRDKEVNEVKKGDIKYIALGALKLNKNNIYGSVERKVIGTKVPMNFGNTFKIDIYTIPSENDKNDSFIEDTFILQKLKTTTKYTKEEENNLYSHIFKNGSLISTLSFDVVHDLGDELNM